MRPLGALAFAVVCLLVLAGRPGPLRAARDDVVDGRVRVRLAWTGADATCGIARYDVSVRRNDHRWKRSGDTTASHAARDLRVGPTYRFRVRGLDKAGNLGDWTAGSTFRIVGTKAHPRVDAVEP